MKGRICVVFDVDDTLYLERDYVRSGFEAVGRWAAKWIQAEEFGERCWEEFNSGKRGSIFNDVLAGSGKEVNPTLISALVEIYRTHTPSIRLAPDAAEALEAIGRFAPVAVITDGPVISQSRKAEALGLSSFATPIILTEILGVEFRKPHCKAFEWVSQRHPASVYAYIADNPLKDFTAPIQMGWMTVRVRRSGGLHRVVENSQIKPDLEMTDCSGLPELLSGL
jgi:putative hydrolase of the HAD superfamily